MGEAETDREIKNRKRQNGCLLFYILHRKEQQSAEEREKEELYFLYWKQRAGD